MSLSVWCWDVDVCCTRGLGVVDLVRMTNCVCLDGGTRIHGRCDWVGVPLCWRLFSHWFVLVYPNVAEVHPHVTVGGAPCLDGLSLSPHMPRGPGLGGAGTDVSMRCVLISSVFF